MRLLVDESLSARISAPLIAAGHDAIHVADLRLLGASDDAVLAAAVEDQRILVTADTDFGALLALSGAPMPSVVLLRRSGRTVEERSQHVVASLELAGARAEPWGSCRRRTQPLAYPAAADRAATVTPSFDDCLRARPADIRHYRSVWWRPSGGEL